MKKPNPSKQPSPKPEQPAAASAPARAAAVVVKETGSEPVAGRLAAPAALFAVLAALLFWGDTHIFSQSGDFDARVHYPFVSSNELAGLDIREPEDPRLPKGRAVYQLVCAGCHQNDGQGGVAQGCPPLVASDWVLENDPSRLAAIVLKGLTGPITVSGKEYGTGAMLAFESLGDDEIASVLSVIRNNWGNKAPLVDVAQVKAIRAQVKGHSGYMTVPDLMKIPVKP